MYMLFASGFFLFVLPTNHTMALRMVSLFVGLAVAMVAIRRHGMPAVPIRWPLLAWIGLALLSLLWSEKPAFTLGEIKSEIGYGLVAFFSFFVLTHTQREMRLWLHIAVASLALTLVLGMIDYWTGEQQGISPYMRWDSVHGYASYATYLVTIVPILIYWVTNVSWRLRFFGTLLIATYLFVAYLLGNRMLWLSVAIAISVFAALYGWRWRHDASRFFKGLLPLVIALTISCILFLQVAILRPADFARPVETAVSGTDKLVQVFTKSERLYMWSYWLDRIEERPWTGVGFGRDLPHWVYEKPADWPDLYFAHAHNIVLDYGLQMGVLGIVVLLWLFGAIAWRFFRYTTSGDETAFLVGTTGLALVIAFFSKNLTDELFWRTDALVFWSFTGILLGFGERIFATRLSSHHQ